MKYCIDFVSRLYTRLDSIEWVARLTVRIAVGLEFFGSGLGKLGKLSGLIQYFRSLGIPGAEILAPFVASTELVCGVLIAVGLATRPAAVMLCGVMLVAIVTAAAPEKHITATWHGLLEFFYLPEVLLLLLLAWLVVAGPGRAGLHARVGGPSTSRVAGALDQLDTCGWDQPLPGLRVLRHDEPVGRAPQDQGRRRQPVEALGQPA